MTHSAQFRPPMPWFALHAMNDDNLQAIFYFVSYLGPSGQPAPTSVLSDREPETPYVLFPDPSKQATAR